MAEGPPPSDAGPSRLTSMSVNNGLTQNPASQTASWSFPQQTFYHHFSSAAPTPQLPYSQTYNASQSINGEVTIPAHLVPLFTALRAAASEAAKPPSPSPSPSPPPLPSHWDEALRHFLEKAGLKQASRGLEGDMLILNPQWERKIIANALEELHTNLGVSRLQQASCPDLLTNYSIFFQVASQDPLI